MSAHQPGRPASADAPAHPVEQAPPAAGDVFGARLPLARRLVSHLATSGVQRGLVGPREAPRLWSRHVLNCAVVGELLPVGADVVDVGSGAGLPGLVLAVARPDLRLTLVEPMERRCAWLCEVAADLDLTVEVRRARAEELHGVTASDVVTARAVARLDKLARWCLPLLRPGGELLALKGRTAEAELHESRPALRRAGAVAEQIVRCGGSVLADPTTVVRVRVGPHQRPAAGQRRTRR